jgi:hypothetical protein
VVADMLHSMVRLPEMSIAGVRLDGFDSFYRRACHQSLVGFHSLTSDQCSISHIVDKFKNGNASRNETSETEKISPTIINRFGRFMGLQARLNHFSLVQLGSSNKVLNNHSALSASQSPQLRTQFREAPTKLRSEEKNAIAPELRQIPHLVKNQMLQPPARLPKHIIRNYPLPCQHCACLRKTSTT